MIIEIKLTVVQASGVELFIDADQLCVRGQHADHGPFEVRFGIPPDRNLAAARVVFITDYR